MPVPDQVPRTPDEPSETMRRKRALESVRTHLVAATTRLHEFLPDKTSQEIIRRVHTAQTEIINNDDDPEIVTYYSLWADFGDIRLTQSGQLLRSDTYPDKYSDLRAHGVDKSAVVTMYDLRSDTETYKTVHLISLANALEKFLRPAEAE